MMLATGAGARRLWGLGELVEERATAEETVGVYGVIVDRGPPGVGAPPHVLHVGAEGFYLFGGQ